MNSLENAIGSLGIENRFDAVMRKIGLAAGRERISVPEASGKSAEKTSDIKKEPSRELNLKK